jgi:hypothetical protein
MSRDITLLAGAGFGPATVGLWPHEGVFNTAAMGFERTERRLLIVPPRDSDFLAGVARLFLCDVDRQLSDRLARRRCFDHMIILPSALDLGG